MNILKVICSQTLQKFKKILGNLVENNIYKAYKIVL